MKKYLIIVLIEIFIFVSCDKKEDSITYEFMSSMIDTLVIGKPFAPSLFITSPPAKVTFYLEGPIKDSKKKVGNFLYDNTSDSLYISDDMLFIQEISSFEKNNYNKKYWRIPFIWIPSPSQVEANNIYCLVIQSIWEVDGVPRTTWKSYFYMKED